MKLATLGRNAQRVQVRRFADRDWPEVRAFYERCYRPGYVLAERGFFDWYFASPLQRSRVSGELLALAGDRVVGIMGSLAWPLQVDGRFELGQYNVNLMVDPAWRGRGLGARLLEETLSEVRCAVSIGVEPGTVSMYRRHGRVVLWPMRRWVRVLEEDAVRALVAEGPGFSTAAPDACTAVLATLRASAGAKVPASSPEIEPVGRFGADWDGAWRELRRSYPFTTWRDSAFLNWRYCDCPRPRYEPLVWRSGGDIRGLIVLRQEEPPCGRVIRVVDLVAADLDRARLLAAAVAEGARRRAILVDVIASSHLPEAEMQVLGLAEVELPGSGTAVPLDFNPIRYRPGIETLVVFLDPKDPAASATGPDDYYIVKGDGDQDRAN